MKVKCKFETINYKTLMFFIAIFFNSSKTIKVGLYCIKIYKKFHVYCYILWYKSSVHIHVFGLMLRVFQ